MKKSIAEVEGLPQPASPYSLGVIAGPKFIFVSGQGPWDPATGKLERGSITEQTRLTLENVKRIVEAGGGRMETRSVCRIFLQPLTTETFAEMNVVYRGYWGEEKPARTTVGSQLLNFDVEIDCIVALD